MTLIALDRVILDRQLPLSVTGEMHDGLIVATALDPVLGSLTYILATK